MKPLLLVLVLLSLSLPVWAQTPVQHQNLNNGIAIHGYDAVSYLDDRKAQKGSTKFTAQYNGATYRFASAAHRDAFMKEPAKYEPAYGGWCAYAIGATNEKVDVDPETFKIVDGRTHLFYNAFFGNTLPKWNKDEANLKATAQKNWQQIVKQSSAD